MRTTSGRLSGHALGIAAASAVVVFLVVILVVPAYYPSYDEVKYFSIGANLWAGRGPLTAFGDPFLLHAPLWMALVYAPRALAGVDPVVWGHILNAAAGAGIIALVAIMGRRSSPLAGVVAAFGMLAFTYLLNLSRTARLDVPVAFLALLYLEIGWRAVQGGSARLALAAGATFAAAVWVKEVPIPLAPVPMLCGALAGIPWTRLLRSTGLVTLAAVVGLAPWFAYYAAETGRVYRLGTHAWTIVPALAPLLVLIALGLAADRLAANASLQARLERLGRRLPAVRSHGRAIVGWGGAAAWTAVFVVFFSRVSRLGGISILQVAQLRYNLETWRIELLPVGLFAVVGLLLAIAMLATDRDAPERLGTRNALVASICGLSLVVFVMAVGEPPRNYIAQVGTAVAMSAGAWAWAVRRLAVRLGRGGHAVRGRRVVLAAAVAAMVVGTAAIGVRGWLTRHGTGAAGPTAARTAVEWVKANVPHGSTVAIGAYLSYDIAYDLVADYPLVQLAARLSMVDPAAPEGLRWGDERPAADWVSADTAPKNVNQFEAFRAAWITAAVQQDHIAYWVYATGASTAAPSILNQLTPDHGFTKVASWSFPTSGHDPVAVDIFRVDPAAAPDPATLYTTPEGLTRLVGRLALEPATARQAASTLDGRVVVRPESPAADQALQQLRALAGN